MAVLLFLFSVLFTPCLSAFAVCSLPLVLVYNSSLKSLLWLRPVLVQVQCVTIDHLCSTWIFTILHFWWRSAQTTANEDVPNIYNNGSWTNSVTIFKWQVILTWSCPCCPTPPSLHDMKGSDCRRTHKASHHPPLESGLRQTESTSD